LFFHSAGLFNWTVLFFGINGVYFFVFEEPDVEAPFGEEYRVYKKNVPRWIPRLTPFELVSGNQ
jgi:protein-S-isoprenylcysteine O-methyltransferase Ste14